LLPIDPQLVEGIDLELYQCPIWKGLREIEWWPLRGISEATASTIDTLLNTNAGTKGIAADRSRLGESEEAWVYVTIASAQNALYSGFGKSKGVLVWPNSD
jgi:hypothetical protein